MSEYLRALNENKGRVARYVRAANEVKGFQVDLRCNRQTVTMVPDGQSIDSTKPNWGVAVTTRIVTEGLEYDQAQFLAERLSVAFKEVGQKFADRGEAEIRRIAEMPAGTVEDPGAVDYGQAE